MPYVTKAEVRALPNMADTVKFTDAELDAAIEWFEQKFEDYTGIAWIPRTTTERISGDGSTSILLRRFPVRSVQAVRIYTDAATSTAFTAAELADIIIDNDVGLIQRVSLGNWPRGYSNIGIDYTHGTATIPADVKEAALWAVRDKVMTDNVGHRQFSVQTEAGVARNIIAGPDHPFGIDQVDEVANRRKRLPAIV